MNATATTYAQHRQHALNEAVDWTLARRNWWFVVPRSPYSEWLKAFYAVTDEDRERFKGYYSHGDQASESVG